MEKTPSRETPMPRLVTILHISDLHIGHIDPATGDAAVSNAAAFIFANHTCFDGVLGHHGRALKDLQQFYNHEIVEKEGEHPILVVSGDLTRVGDVQEFNNAADYLERTIDLNPPRGNNVGLNRGTSIDIPGNHDRWPGTPTIFGGPHAGFHARFPPNSLPSILPLILANGRTIEFIRIDTDASVSPRGQKRLRAVGSFQKQLGQIANQLGSRPKNSIRVLLMHHSWHRRGITLSIDRGSRGALNQFLVAHSIQVLMTGHVHTSYVQKFVPPIAGGQTVLECRCGTTTQIDQVSYTWRNFLGTFPHRGWPRNKLLVHRIYQAGSKTEWRVETFVRTNNGFVTEGPTGMESVDV
jgi:3',5'-cyclic AMP phosphodiesterase CpdA